MLMDKKYDCRLYTLNGVKPAVAIVEKSASDRVRVTAKDGSFTIRVLRSLAEGKFWNDENPTFYAC